MNIKFGIDNESNVFNKLISLKPSETMLFHKSDTEELIFNSIVNNSDNWVNNASNTNCPPDFYNDSDMLMMDIFQINDYEEQLASGKVKNELKIEENRMAKRLFTTFPNILPENITVCSDIEIAPSYSKYFNNFTRVFTKHNKQINTYKLNHPNHSVILGIIDTSEHYHKIYDSNWKYLGCTHMLFDRRFLEVIKSSDADFVLWFMPYITPDMKLPYLVIVDVKLLDTSKYSYFIY